MRLDQYLVKLGHFQSRERAKEAILTAGIVVNGKIAKKASIDVSEVDKIMVEKPDFIYVSRGALKLKAALEKFKIEVAGKICLDIGVATGGFTQVLLEAGANKVYAVDIGEGQLADLLRRDSRVEFRNNTDARYLKKTDFDFSLDLVVIDVSFISILALLPALKEVVSKGELVALIKPQFEYGKPHSGVISDAKIIAEILAKVRAGFSDNGFEILGEIPSPIRGKEGNQEFLWRVVWKNKVY
ncbi:TlyA family RNA methyltransferase [Candidatus Peregrinibacteria bacterium]|nr:TlyA family RNA methyltransferase [Candidatus Peregrinibacteria bacterium]